MTDPAHYDESWKEALDLYFDPLLRFFFPKVHGLIDWTREIEFLDTQLQELLPASEVGTRIADKLVKAWLITGEATFILVHLEIQSQHDASFGKRMFIYHYRIFDAFDHPVVSLAILGDDSSKWRPKSYGYSQAGCGIRLRFPMVKLIDYEQRWSELESSDSPMAILVMAHLRTQSTTRDPLSRKQWKWSLTRRLYESGFSRQDIVQLFRILDWMMTLPPDLKRQFRDELTEYEEREKMPLLSSIEQMALERGRQEGEQRIKMIAQALLRRGLSIEEVAQITELSLEELRSLSSTQPN